MDRPRPVQQDYAGASVAFVLPTPLSQALLALARSHRCSLFSVLLAAWALLLSRLSGEQDLVIGTAVVGRTRSEIEPLIGLFVNTVALRFQVPPHGTLRDWLQQVRDVVLSAQDHQDLPFERVVELLQPPRALGHTPIYQVMFALDTMQQGQSLALPGLEVAPLCTGQDSIEFDLSVSMQQHGEALSGRLGYATALFDSESMQRHVAQFLQLLQAIGTDANPRLARLSWLPQEQREQLLHDFNATAAPLTPAVPLCQALLAQVQRTPQATAVIDGELGLSYAQLWSRATCLADHLQQQGLQPGQPVALLLPRSASLVVTQLAVLRCGACYVPMDPEQPAERLGQLLRACDARLAVMHAQMPPLDVAGLQVVDPNRWALDGHARLHHVLSHPRALAYVMYTSGSTGMPKGVAVSHAAVLNLVLQDGPARLRSDDRVAFASNPAFDSATLEIWGSLLNGASVVVVPAPVMRDPHALGALLVRERLSVLILVAGVLRTYASAIAEQLGDLRLLMTGGDIADPHALATVLDAGGHATILQTHGPTESTQFVTMMALQHAPDAAHRVPIGRPLANTRLYVLDRHGQPTPIGVTGQLHVAGAQLAQGYLHRPAPTAERFVPDPFAEIPGERMYKTGDLACWRADGTLDFLGRNDAQIKIRGFRIEPGEIEAASRACAGVQEAVVVARDDTGEKRLVAYVVADRNAAPAEPATLRTQLAAHLPDHMLLAAYVQLDALPLTPNGKLDRAALPAPDTQALDLHAYVTPQGELEQMLATLWSGLLGAAQVGRNDDFFALGGHSLLAVKLIERLRRLGWQIDVRALFARPTLAGLAENLQAASTNMVPPNRIGPDCTRITPDLLPLVTLTQGEIDAVVATVGGGAANVQDIYPLAPLQEGLLFHHLGDPLADPYLHSSVLGFPSKERRDGFLDALDHIVARHDILRTGFVWQGLCAPVQVVWKTAVVPRHQQRFDGPDPAAQFQAWLHAPRAALGLQHAPLIHAHFANDTTTGRWLLGLQHHHLVMDHTTLELVIEEVGAFLAGTEHSLPAPLPFREFVARARPPARRGADADAGSVLQQTAGRCHADHRALRHAGCARRWPHGARSAPAGSRRADPGAACAGACVGCEHGQPVPSRLRIGGGYHQRTRRRGVRHHAVRPHAGRWRHPPRAGHVPQYLAAAPAHRLDQRG
ncbi:hypothetical protein BVV20_11310 [Xanthomonas oryzae pv. oryzae]|nr:hypothetical protein BVV20_11310 [Xanthomonas oryzae pv. oryzae]